MLPAALPSLLPAVLDVGNSAHYRKLVKQLPVGWWRAEADEQHQHCNALLDARIAQRRAQQRLWTFRQSTWVNHRGLVSWALAPAVDMLWTAAVDRWRDHRLELQLRAEWRRLRELTGWRMSQMDLAGGHVLTAAECDLSRPWVGPYAGCSRMERWRPSLARGSLKGHQPAQARARVSPTQDSHRLAVRRPCGQPQAASAVVVPVLSATREREA